MSKEDNSRRKFLKRGALAGLGTALSTGMSQSLLGGVSASGPEAPPSNANEPIIDIHQHIFYHGRTDDQLIHHQQMMGVTQTIMLPAGTPVNTMSTHFGYSNGLQAHCGGNQSCYDFAQAHAASFLFGSNEVPDLPTATKEIEKYLKLGGKIIAEVKFGVACDSLGMQKIYQLAQEYDVPILMHWLYEVYNYGFPRFYKMLEKYPKVKFIGHAQTWWANIDKGQQDHPWEAYPKGPVTPGGITDRYLSDYPNMYGDLSAGSGLNAYLRDEDFTRDFFTRHQDKLIFGSDCADAVGEGKACDGSQIIATVRRLASSKSVERKLLYENAKKLFKL
jgi:predicted TIM-barrel fold metal-dependent hydrolase